ncbi:RHS repeat protein [Paraherbaspirillum soli]|uniref:RHS repeat protein n=1 Tax=Paraherbaspirillum soli TaxID=631222 RepID=A0ABW0M425_9BURK
MTDTAGKTTGWQYTTADGDNVETYNAAGLLIAIANRNGMTQTLSYSGNLLTRVTDNGGRQLNFTYDAKGRIHTVTDPAGGAITYTYDTYYDQFLSTVTYQDGKVRRYVYNETGYHGSLTGIVDENGARFATFGYDGNGKAVSTEHAGGVEKYSVITDTGNKLGTVTDPLGAIHTYNFQVILGVLKSTGQTRSAGSGSTAATTVLTYDANGNVASYTDFNGAVTTFSYDLIRNLETSRVEASGTPQARTISTQWHPSFSLPLKLAEPKRVTSYSYDASGNLLSKTEQATSDATGAQGLAPTVTGSARSWSYSYNNVGQLLTAIGPRTDVADKTTYAYDSNGNLSTISNAVGQVTSLSNYDANGRVGLIADANGVTTTLTYSPRGWLTGKTVTANGMTESTSYSYDGVGQLTQVTLPNASTVSYSYDPAHRLIKIADSVGNSIVYTLDNMGNRLSEQVKDPSGALARQTSRVIDALNRLQQITGAVQ